MSNTDITGFKITKLPTIKPDTGFKDSRFQLRENYFKKNSALFRYKRLRKSQRRIDRLITKLDDGATPETTAAEPKSIT